MVMISQDDYGILIRRLSAAERLYDEIRWFRKGGMTGATLDMAIANYTNAKEQK